MIDFRYHLVSLIAVFLALALGILLGAGPLNQTIGDQLTSQVEELRADSDRLRTDLDVAQREVANRDDFIDEIAPAALGSRLEGRAVAVVSLPDAVDDDVSDISQRLEQAGAAVSAQVAVTPAWTDPDTADARAEVAAQTLAHLDPAPDEDASTDTILGIALGQALTRGDGEGTPTAEASTLLELLTAADTPLVDIVDEPSTAADATVVVGPRAELDPVEQAGTPGEDEVAEREQRLAVEIALATGLAETGEGAVVSGSATTDLDLLSLIRATAPEAVTTVDSVADVAGRVNVPLALAAAISGVTDHYGFGTDANTPVPESVYLPPPAPGGPPEPEGPAGDAPEQTDTTTGDDG